MADDVRFSFEEAQRFLKALDPEAERFTFQLFDDQGANKSLARIIHGPFAEVAKRLFQISAKGAGVYVTVNETDFKGRRDENIVAPRAVFCDFDEVDPPRGCGALPISAVVESKRGKHLYWFLQPEDGNRQELLAKWTLVQKALAGKLGSDPGISDWPRVMRLPGSIHRKGEPFPVRLIDCLPDRRYTLDEIIHAYGLQLEKEEPKVVKIWPSRSRGTSPADDYNARGDWSVLGRHGWTLMGSYGDEGRWSRPGKNPPGISATTDHVESGGTAHHGIFYVFSSNAQPFAANKGYTRFQVLAVLDHGGDYKSAAKELVAQGYGSDDREQWLAERLKEREEAEWEAALAHPPPDLDRPRRKPQRPRGEQPPEPPLPTDDDVPPEASNVVPFEGREKKGGKGGGRGKGKGGKGKRGKGGGRPPNIKDAENDLCDFRVSSVKILTSDPPVYYLEVDGSKMLELLLDDMDTPRRFRKRFMGQLHRRPSVPLDEDEWNFVVNYWLGMAELIDQPEEASLTGQIRSELRDLIRQLALGDHPADLERGRILPNPQQGGAFLFKFAAVMHLLRDRMGNRQLDPERVGAQLRALNCEPIRIRLEGSQYRLWTFELELDDPEGLPSSEPSESRVDP